MRLNTLPRNSAYLYLGAGVGKEKGTYCPMEKLYLKALPFHFFPFFGCFPDDDEDPFVGTATFRMPAR